MPPSIAAAPCSEPPDKAANWWLAWPIVVVGLGIALLHQVIPPPISEPPPVPPVVTRDTWCLTPEQRAEAEPLRRPRYHPPVEMTEPIPEPPLTDVGFVTPNGPLLVRLDAVRVLAESAEPANALPAVLALIEDVRAGRVAEGSENP